jgi:hypothetical protein
MATTDILLIELAKEGGKTVRQDRYMMQLVSLGSARGKRGYQWQKLDDKESDAMDIIDHMPLDIDRLLHCGPGPSFGPKLMLGSIDLDMDRSLKRKDKSLTLYGEECTRLTKEEMEKCPCQTEPMSDQTTSARIQRAQKQV